MPSIQEFLIVIAVITMLSAAGIWPTVMRGLRELRGEHVEDPEGTQGASSNTSSRELDLCFKMLGVSPSAPWEAVEKAYKQKAKRHHPDLGGDEDAMRALNHAYELIKKARNRP